MLAAGGRLSSSPHPLSSLLLGILYLTDKGRMAVVVKGQLVLAHKRWNDRQRVSKTEKPRERAVFSRSFCLTLVWIDKLSTEPVCTHRNKGSTRQRFRFCLPSFYLSSIPQKWQNVVNLLIIEYKVWRHLFFVILNLLSVREGICPNPHYTRVDNPRLPSENYF